MGLEHGYTLGCTVDYLMRLGVNLARYTRRVTLRRVIVLGEANEEAVIPTHISGIHLASGYHVHVEHAEDVHLVEAKCRVDCNGLVSHGVLSIGCDCVCHGCIVAYALRIVKPNSTKLIKYPLRLRVGEQRMLRMSDMRMVMRADEHIRTLVLLALQRNDEAESATIFTG